MTTTEQPTTVTIDPDDITTFYFRPVPGPSGAPLPTDLGPVEISIDNGLTWTTLTLGQDNDGEAAYPWTVAGPAAREIPAGVMQLVGWETPGLKRVVDNPERTTRRFTIYARR